MEIKAACILANFDSESMTITVYKHRIFPFDKVLGALKWVEKTLRVAETFLGAPYVAQSNEIVNERKQNPTNVSSVLVDSFLK